MSISTSTAPAEESARNDEASAPAGDGPSALPAIEAELLIEEISIDGMCGVY